MISTTKAPVAKIKLPSTKKIPILPTIIRSRSLSVPSSGNLTAALNNSRDVLVGGDHKFLIHKAFQGENLEYYAARYKTDLKSIAAVNYKMPSPAWVIPVGLTDVSKLPSFLPYEVKEKGLTIEALARKLKVNLSDLKYYNGIQNAELVITNNWLLIPQTKMPASDPITIIPTIFSPLKKHQLDVPIGTDHKFVIHKILDEENLHQYASIYKTSMEAIFTVAIIPPLWAGTMAVIPVGFTDVSNSLKLEVYEVQGTNRSIESLVEELHVDPRKLVSYNDLAPDEQLQSGDWLLIPRSKSSALWRSASLSPNNLYGQ